MTRLVWLWPDPEVLVTVTLAVGGGLGDRLSLRKERRTDSDGRFRPKRTHVTESHGR